MRRNTKWLLWLMVLAQSSAVAYFMLLPPRAGNAPERLALSAPAAPRPLPVPQPQVETRVVVREVPVPATPPALPEFIDGGSFVIPPGTWTDVYTLPTRQGEWEDKPGLPKNLFEMRELLMRKYSWHSATTPDVVTPGQLEYLANGDPDRHGLCPDSSPHAPFFGTLAFMRYRPTGNAAVTVHRYWTLGRTPDTVKVDH